MQYVWQHRLWPAREMLTVDGVPIHVLDPGRLNTDAGPDFFNAKVKIGPDLWAGDVEIHVRASDWHRHHHDGDPAYESVILHVVDRDDTMIRRANGEVIPQMCMPCATSLQDDYMNLVDRSASDLPCADTVKELPGLLISDWLSALTFERLYSKSGRIDALRELNSGDSEEACYVTLARSLGFGVNSEPFERLARSLPLRVIGKHRDNLLAVEAMLMGQSGLLNPYLAPEADSPPDPYIKSLASEYRFLASKFSLKPLQSAGWKMGRMRPANFPHRRIAYLARLLHSVTNLASKLIEASSPDEVRDIFDVELTGFWAGHFHFGDTSASARSTHLSRTTIDTIIINVAVPVMFNHGVVHGDDSTMQRAVDLLSGLAPERNSVVELFGRCGITAPDAATSQALIHLRRNYCEMRKCLYCRFGHRLLSHRARRVQPLDTVTR